MAASTYRAGSMASYQSGPTCGLGSMLAASAACSVLGASFRRPSGKSFHASHSSGAPPFQEFHARHT